MLQSKIKRVLVSGANCDIGPYVIRMLEHNGLITKVMIPSQTDASRLNGISNEIIVVDFPDIQSVQHAVNGCDAVVHLAPNSNSNNNNKSARTMTSRTCHLVEACHMQDVNRFIYVSSVSTIHPEPNSYSHYAQAAENCVTQSGLDYTILRPAMIYGKGSDDLNYIVKKIINFHNFTPIPGVGRHLIQPVYVWDVADAIFKCLFQPRSITKSYNIGGRETISYHNLILMIQDMLGIKKHIVPIPPTIYRLVSKIARSLQNHNCPIENFYMDDANISLDISAAMRDMDYSPHFLQPTLLKVLDQIINDRDDTQVPDEFDNIMLPITETRMFTNRV
ncbi:NAD(P)H-binding protein [candidate division KSB1 bacterium]|nr:NAD(P)H-binding protein [candidate division KSB1 bacterium]